MVGLQLQLVLEVEVFGRVGWLHWILQTIEMGGDFVKVDLAVVGLLRME